MKIIHSNYKEGKVKLRIDCLEDLDYLERVIKPNDEISGKTSRKLAFGEKEKAERKALFLKIKVEKVKMEKDSLRALGPIIEALSDDVSKGEYHSFGLEPGTIITIQKKEWNALDIDRLSRAVRDSETPKVFLALLDMGHADFFTLSGTGLKEHGSIDFHVSGKQYDEKQEANPLELFNKVKDKMEEFKELQLIVGSIGFIGEQFKEYLEQKKIDFREKIVYAKVNNVGRNGANELLKSKNLEKLLEKQRVYNETLIIEDFFTKIALGGKANYGFNEVFESAKVGAVEKLIISDSFIEQNKEKAEELINLVQKFKGIVKIVSSGHESGQKFQNIGGIGAFLRY